MRTLLLIIALASAPLQAADLGASLSGDYFLNAKAPAGWYITQGKPLQYHADATLYISHAQWRFALKSYIEGTGTPQLAGAYLGIGRKFDATTVSLFHHSCHNLDRAAYVTNRITGWLEKAPGCDFNGIQARMEFGQTFAPLW